MREFTILGQPVAKEDCKSIPGFERYYALRDGRIYSSNSDRILSQVTTKDGYWKVTLFKNGRGTTKKTHVFIAQAFMPNPYNKPQVNHINGDKLDNRVENLEWVTQRENIDHAMANGLISSEKAKTGYQIKRRIYGDKYLSQVARENGKKTNAKQAQKTREKKYGKDAIKKQAKIASDKARELNIKRTKLIDLESMKVIGVYNSRTELANFLNVDSRRISEAIKQDKILKSKYIVKEAN